MQLIVIASRKGGVGKTTLSAHLAVVAEQTNPGKVALLDFDPQGSLTWWATQRNTGSPRFDSIEPEQLGSHMTRLKKEGVELLIVDTPPIETPWINKLMGKADLVVVPTRASPLDIHAIGTTMKAAQHAQTNMVWVLNGVSSRSKIADAVADELKRFAPLAPVNVHERTDYVLAMGQGRTVVETKASGISAKEIRSVWKFISSKLSKAKA
jgi:chromosome partitioning protein